MRVAHAAIVYSPFNFIIQIQFFKEQENVFLLFVGQGTAMCGITAYLGAKQAAQILLNGLARLEYRGYDSAGVAIYYDGKLSIKKKVGKVKELHAAAINMPGSTGIGHTRWATHGEPSERNAHPHVPAAQSASDSTFALVHNGIIENFKTLKESLTRKGHTFYSDTDTEVLVKLIEDVKSTTGKCLEEAVRQALSQVVGAYGICVCSREDPDILVAARQGSPLMLGIGEGEWFIASDAAAFLEYTRQAKRSKVLYIVTFFRKYSRTLTFENECCTRWSTSTTARWL
jgi:glucosamine--fructose-6-phosphate aminotransferase (isomerizing)